MRSGLQDHPLRPGVYAVGARRVISKRSQANTRGTIVVIFARETLGLEAENVILILDIMPKGDKVNGFPKLAGDVRRSGVIYGSVQEYC